MWDVASGVLEKAGVVALFFFLSLVGGAFLIRWFVKKLAEESRLRVAAEERINAIVAEESAKRAKVRLAHEQQLNQMRAAHDAEIAALHEERRIAAEQFAQRLEELQERRLEEARTIVREVVENAGATRRSMDKISDVLEWLRMTMMRTPPTGVRDG